MNTTTDLFSALLLCTIPLSCIAILLSCVSIAVVVGLKNSTHKIEWKTYDPSESEREIEQALEEESVPLMEENPNKRLKRNEPFAPFPPEPKEEDPFFDEEDPNNISHDFNS